MPNMELLIQLFKLPGVTPCIEKRAYADQYQTLLLRFIKIHVEARSLSEDHPVRLIQSMLEEKSLSKCSDEHLQAIGSLINECLGKWESEQEDFKLILEILRTVLVGLMALTNLRVSKGKKSKAPEANLESDRLTLLPEGISLLVSPSQRSLFLGLVGCHAGQSKTIHTVVHLPNDNPRLHFKFAFSPKEVIEHMQRRESVKEIMDGYTGIFPCVETMIDVVSRTLFKSTDTHDGLPLMAPTTFGEYQCSVQGEVLSIPLLISLHQKGLLLGEHLSIYDGLKTLSEMSNKSVSELIDEVVQSVHVALCEVENGNSIQLGEAEKFKLLVDYSVRVKRFLAKSETGYLRSQSVKLHSSQLSRSSPAKLVAPTDVAAILEAVQNVLKLNGIDNLLLFDQALVSEVIGFLEQYCTDYLKDECAGKSVEEILVFFQKKMTKCIDIFLFLHKRMKMNIALSAHQTSEALVKLFDPDALARWSLYPLYVSDSDGGGHNIAMVPTAQGGTYVPVKFDGEKSLENLTGGKKVQFIDNVNAFWFLPYHGPIPDNVRGDILSLSPTLLVLEILLRYREYEIKCEETYMPHDFKERSGWPLQLPYQFVIDLMATHKRHQEILQSNSNADFREFFQSYHSGEYVSAYTDVAERGGSFVEKEKRIPHCRLSGSSSNSTPEASLDQEVLSVTDLIWRFLQENVSHLVSDEYFLVLSKQYEHLGLNMLGVVRSASSLKSTSAGNAGLDAAGGAGDGNSPRRRRNSELAPHSPRHTDAESIRRGRRNSLYPLPELIRQQQEERQRARNGLSKSQSFGNKDGSGEK